MTYAAATDVATRFGNLELVRLADQPRPGPRRYLVQGLIPEGWTTILYGPSQSRKSFVAMYLAVCVAAGREAFGLLTTPGPVVYIDAEMDEETALERAYALAAGFGLDRPPPDLHYLNMVGRSLVDEAVRDTILARVGQLNPALIVIDSLMWAAGTSNQDAANEVVPIMTALTKFGTVIVIDHVSKAGRGSTPIGSIGKYNFARSNIQAKRTGAMTTLEHMKLSFGETLPPIHLAFAASPKGTTFTLAPDSPLAAVNTALRASDRVLAALRSCGRWVTAEEVWAATGGEGIQLTTVKKELRKLVKRGEGEARGPNQRRQYRAVRSLSASSSAVAEVEESLAA